jgi:hypothetical protein
VCMAGGVVPTKKPTLLRKLDIASGAIGIDAVIAGPDYPVFFPSCFRVLCGSCVLLGYVWPWGVV